MHSLYKKTAVSKGFTLIELLVVVAIISLLSSVVFASLSTARAKARDASRKAQLNQLQAALELYHNTNNAYPTTGGAWYSSETGDQASNNGGNWIPGLAPTYISSLPDDPQGGAAVIQPACGPWLRSYLYKSDSSHYKLLAHCSPESTWTSGYSFYDPIRPANAWMVCSSEPACSTW